MLGTGWRTRADFEPASRRTARRAVRYQWISLRDCWGRSCGTAATATTRRVTAAVQNSASSIRTRLGMPTPGAAPASPSSSRLSPMSSIGITADLCRAAVEAASKVRAAPTANVSCLGNACPAGSYSVLIFICNSPDRDFWLNSFTGGSMGEADMPNIVYYNRDRRRSSFTRPMRDPEEILEGLRSLKAVKGELNRTMSLSSDKRRSSSREYRTSLCFYLAHHSLVRSILVRLFCLSL